MIEQQLEERLRLAVADEPPLGFDPDDLVDRAFRRQRNRRAIGAAAAAVAVVATAVTVAFGGTDTASPPIGSASSGLPVPPGEGCQAEPPYNGDPRAVLAAMNALDPELIADYDLPDVRTGPTCGIWYAEGPGRTVATSYNADNGASVGLSITHNKLVLDPDADWFAAQPDWQGEEDKLQDGSLLRVHTVKDDPCDNGTCFRYDVVHLRTDGVAVAVSLFSPDEEGEQWIADRLAMAKELAQDPRLTF